MRCMTIMMVVLMTAVVSVWAHGVNVVSGRHLPQGFTYKEYVVPTPGVSGPGHQRIVVGSDGSWYYSLDHYHSFKKFIP